MSRIFREAFSQENNDPSVSAGSAVEAELALESATVEIQEAAHEMEVLNYQQEELDHAAQSLEGIAMSLESLLEDDPRGLDRVGAQAYSHAVKAVVGDAMPNPVASLESFGGESECSEASKLSLESIKDTIKKVWEGIKRAIKNAIQAVGDFFSKLFNGVSRLKTRLEKLEKDVKDLKGKSPQIKGDSDTYNVPGASRVAIGGKVDFSTLTSGRDQVEKAVAGRIDEIVEGVSAWYEAISEFYKKKANEEELVKADQFGTKKMKESLEKTEGPELPGGKQVIKEHSEGSEGYQTFSFRVADKDGVSEVKNAETKVPSLDDIEKEVKALLGIVEQIEKKKDKVEKLKKAREEVVKNAEDWVKDAADGKLQESWTQAKVNMALRLSQRDYASQIGRLTNYLFSFSRAYAGVLNAAYSRYEEGKSE